MNDIMEVRRRRAGRDAHGTLLLLPTLAAALALAAFPEPGQAQEIVIRPQAQRALVVCPSGPTTDQGTAAGWLGMELRQTWPPQPGILPGRMRQDGQQAGGGTGTPTDLEIRVSAVAEGGPAELAGIRRGDRLLSVDGEQISPSLLDRLALGVPAGAEAVVGIERDGEEFEFVVEATERPCVWPGSAALAVHLDSVRVRLRDQGEALQRMQIRMDTAYTAWLEGVRETAEAREARVRAAAERASEMGERVRLMRIEAGAPLVLGQRIVAGAELSPLNPDLARYFGTSDGLLVLSVTGGSPAERAGLLAGDVVVAIGGEDVRDLAGARTEFSRAFASPPVPVAVIREGERMSLEFRP
ncbi:MAG: PDZ domain-containing protein [Gemmatimonadota bacterium]